MPVDVVEVRKNLASFADVHISSVIDESIPVDVVGVLGIGSKRYSLSLSLSTSSDETESRVALLSAASRRYDAWPRETRDLYL